MMCSTVEELLRYINRGSSGIHLYVMPGRDGEPYVGRSTGAVTLNVKDHGRVTVSDSCYKKIESHLVIYKEGYEESTGS